MMLRTIVLFVLLLTLTGAMVAPSDYCIVDDNPLAVRGQYTTIQGAIDYGCSYIEVRKGNYPESPVINTAGVTIEAQGAIIPNDGTTCAVTIAAPYVTIKGDLLIQGGSDGTVGGYYIAGTGFCVNASYAHLDGVRTDKVYGFAVLAHNTVDHITLERFEFTHICTTPAPQCLANPAIQFMGSSHNTVRNGLVRGHSGALHTWYGANHTEGYGNRFEQNYGWVWDNGFVPRAIIENYGLGDGNIGNHFYNNVMDGSNGNGLEEADVTHDTVFSDNTIRNVKGCFGVAGSADNRARGILIEGNTCYGNGVDNVSNWFSGDGVLKGNTFKNYVSNNIGTIYIPSDGLGGVVVEGNAFESNGRVMRIEADGVTFRNNEVTGGIYHDNLYIVGSDDHRIENNTLEAQWHSVNMNGGANITIRNNVSLGGFWAGSGNGLTITDNDVTMWGGIYCIAIMVPSNSRVTDNRTRCDGTRSILLDTGATGSLVERNYVTALDGSAVDLPYCNSNNTCASNWTAGQVPPP